MRQALPNAAFLGFTGTPLMAGEERTREVFGDPIIFLDIDGVLVIKPMVWVAVAPYRHVRRVGPKIISAAAFACLNLIADRTGAGVVVSSSWRVKCQCPTILRENGFTGDFHADHLTDALGPDRSAEIERWLIGHNRPQDVISDDWAEGIHGHLENLVHTDFRVGLQSENIDQAVQIVERQLGKDDPPLALWRANLRRA